ncbi:MAG: biotin--[acetyl-CoA-carboxylase] ligase [Phycisphaerae bacterium]|nr:biotin--[acetyl-CoA-carboxylase] ligase [Phycisphaerae bacterium]
MSPDHTILALLYDRADYVALDELARAAGVDRPRLEAALSTLHEGRWPLERTPDRGVRLVRPARPSVGLIERGLGTRRVGRGVLCFDAVASTNDVAWQAAERNDADGLVVLAEYQRRGRGRLGRSWISPPGANLLMSVVLCGGSLPPAEALTVAAGLAVAEGIEAACGLRCSVKWPNDVHLDGRKCAGVLVEFRRSGTGGGLVVGIGVNVAAAPPDDTVHAPAACLNHAVGHAVERVELARAVLRCLDAWVDHICKGRLEELHTRWLARCEMMNQRVRVDTPGGQHVGRVVDVRPLEGLVLVCDDGRRVHIPAGGATLTR